MLTSSARSSASGNGPGPGRAGVGSEWSGWLISYTRATSRRAERGDVRLRNGNHGEHLLENGVRRDFFGERLIREDKAMAERVFREGLQVLGEHVVAPSHECEGARGLHEADRPARARPERDEVLELAHTVGRGFPRHGRDADGVADERRVDVHVE